MAPRDAAGRLARPPARTAPRPSGAESGTPCPGERRRHPAARSTAAAGRRRRIGVADAVPTMPPVAAASATRVPAAHTGVL
ncbi:hypothetical protein DEF23_25410 [Marinitenerispora sediminis]|nr:hypothetical protein DEF23_25410 [Marinitenerispora sediminis]RCV55872.1 hypothetical protein DEF28_04780 [Marinitenerispora sediminis]